MESSTVQVTGSLEIVPEPAASNNTDAKTDDPELPEQFRIRAEKRQRLLGSGDDPYPVRVGRTRSLAQVRADYPDLQAEAETDEIVGVTGRVVFMRNTGKLCFVTLQEGDTRLQGMLSLAEVGSDRLQAWKDDVDLGDHVFLHGRIISSKRGELSVLAGSWQMTAKSLRPLPTMHNELSEEARVRQRYVDLIIRDEARRTVRTRAEVMKSLRTTFDLQGFLEVETPMLQTLHGGATARPFVTHMNAYDIDLYMRIAPELFLKRAVVGGIDKVFEINRNFRNEGADSTHSPEFAMLEAYEAYGDYDSIADLTRELVQNAANDSIGTLTPTLADGSKYDLSGIWPKLGMYESLSEKLGFSVTPDTVIERLKAIADDRGVTMPDAPVTHGKLVEELFEDLVADELMEPTFVYDFPVETSPLVRGHRSKSGVVEKWDLYMRGFEVATGYSELVDPVIQRRRLVEQAEASKAGDSEAMALDEDFLAALEYGMPPSGGMGMGVDRLLMALTGLGVRETIMFPLVKPE